MALPTGRYPGRFVRAPLAATNQQSFPTGTPTPATMMKSGGYETYLCGKWHMGEAAADGPMSWTSFTDGSSNSAPRT